MDTSKITEQLAAHGYIATFWHTVDVQILRPDLTDDQCMEVLLECEQSHDAGIGINWHVIELCAEELFPEPPEAQTAIEEPSI
jgi:hypothetical protein